MRRADWVALLLVAVGLYLWLGCASVRTQEAIDRAEYCESECCCSAMDREHRRFAAKKPALASGVRQ